MYERLRSRSSNQSDLLPASTIPLSEYKSKNASQDSVPSMFAPMLDSPSSSASSRSTPPVKPGIQLSASPGIRLSEQLGAKAYKSAFRVQKTENAVISHYHAANEIPLSIDPTVPETGYPVITSGGLLV
uniref:Uncharacterized protein n=1 Tax=Caenorhabditis tropicalis TaxID=1561998 RepID=A0A1I7V155_9PELO